MSRALNLDDGAEKKAMAVSVGGRRNSPAAAAAAAAVVVVAPAVAVTALSTMGPGAMALHPNRIAAAPVGRQCDDVQD